MLKQPSQLTSNGMASDLYGITVGRKFSYGSRRAVLGRGGSRGQASSSASTA